MECIIDDGSSGNDSGTDCIAELPNACGNDDGDDDGVNNDDANDDDDDECRAMPLAYQALTITRSRLNRVPCDNIFRHIFDHLNRWELFRVLIEN